MISCVYFAIIQCRHATVHVTHRNLSRLCHCAQPPLMTPMNLLQEAFTVNTIQLSCQWLLCCHTSKMLQGPKSYQNMYLIFIYSNLKKKALNNAKPSVKLYCLFLQRPNKSAKNLPKQKSVFCHHNFPSHLYNVLRKNIT